jgi:hypothetical protein
MSAFPPGVDEPAQRRLILRAAKECAPDRVGDFRKHAFTFPGFDAHLREQAWAVALLFWMIFPLFCVTEIALLWRIRRAVSDNWEVWAAERDPDCEMWALEGEIRRCLKQLPRSCKKQARQIDQELKRVALHWSDFARKLEIVNGALSSAPQGMLETRQQELEQRVREESDAVSRASLERSLAAVNGQLHAGEKLRVWRTRLDAARSECIDRLAQMRSQLALSVTTSELGQIGEGAASLEALNRHLGATQDAAEEVLQLRA